MKYVNTGVVFQEIPNEVTLSINISNCPCHCPGCHSQYLWEDIGTPLNHITLSKLINEYSKDITCVSFMGGDADPARINTLAAFVRGHFNNIKIAWYSGRRELSKEIELKNFDFIKLGPYIESFGALKSKTTNQRLYAINENQEMTDITSMFWK